MMHAVPELLVIVACINTSIGAYAFLHAPRTHANQAFFLFSLGTSTWIGGFGLLMLTHLYIFVYILNLGVILLVVGLTWFAQSFPQKQPLPVHPYIFWLPVLVAAVTIAPSTFIVRAVEFLPDGSMNVPSGARMQVWSLILLGYTLVGIWLFVKSYRNAYAKEREELRYVFLGITVFVTAAVTFDAILPAFGITFLNKIGPLSSIFCIAAIAYAIVKYEFMYIRVAIQKGIIYSALVSILSILYILVLEVTTSLFRNVIDVTAPISAAIVIAIGLLTIPRLEQYFRKITDPIFFKNSYVYSDALEELSTALNSNLQFVELVTQSLQALDHIIRPKYIYFYHGLSDSWFGTNGRLSMVPSSLASKEDSRKVSLRVQSGKRLLGEFVLGPKLSEDLYSSQDHTLFRTFSSSAAVAIQKAELYQRLKAHTDTLEEKVSERTRHLQEMQDAQREFFDDISHALQTPLTVLKSGIELLSTSVPATSLKVHNNMTRSVDDLSRLIRNMLELSRIGTPTAETHFEVFDLSICFGRIVEYVGTITEQQNILFSADIEPLLYVRGNQKQIEEVITNLLSNAVRYTEGCAVRAITVGLSGAATETVLTVADTGIGIEADKLPRVFDRFYRAENEDSKGFGLGLAIAKRILTSHDSTIEIQSVLSEGTTVIVRFPRP